MSELFETHDLDTNKHLVAEAKKWLSQPASRRPLVPSDVVAAEEAVRALCDGDISGCKQPCRLLWKVSVLCCS